MEEAAPPFLETVCLLTELPMCSRRQFSGRVKSMVRGGRTQPSTLIFSRLVSFSGQNGMADCARKKERKKINSVLLQEIHSLAPLKVQCVYDP